MSLQIGTRASNFAQYCPDVTNVYIPPANKGYYSADGIPWAIAIGFTHWKGRPTRLSGSLFEYYDFSVHPLESNCMFLFSCIQVQPISSGFFSSVMRPALFIAQ